jgi:hypothetical protein
MAYAASEPAPDRRTFAVPAGDAREALIQEMVAAEPDDANPFRTRKARRRRARTLLAQRDAELHQAATQPFDWRRFEPSRSDAPPERVREVVTV